MTDSESGATVVAFVSQKGGVGKSTLSRGLAREAAGLVRTLLACARGQFRGKGLICVCENIICRLVARSAGDQSVGGVGRREAICSSIRASCHPRARRCAGDHQPDYQQAV